MKQLRVALFMHLLTISDKITRGRLVILALIANSGIFTNADTAGLTAVIDALAAAELKAKDGGKNFKKLMHDAEQVVINKFKDLAQYVETTANGDIAIVHLAMMEARNTRGNLNLDFKVSQGATHGTVVLRVKAHLKTLYKWQYAVDPAGAWTDAGRSDGSSFTANNIPAGLYWFRVIYMDASGDHEGTAASFAVN